jgi:HSP20 family molecular chaperone IbpA
MLMHFERVSDRHELCLKLQLPHNGPTVVEFSVDSQRLVIHKIQPRLPRSTAPSQQLRTSDGAPAPIGLEIPLPLDVNPDTTHATISDGVLDLRFEICETQTGRDTVDIPITAGRRQCDEAPVTVGIYA